MTIPLLQPVTLPLLLPKAVGRGFRDGFSSGAPGASPAGWTALAGAWETTSAGLRKTSTIATFETASCSLVATDIAIEAQLMPSANEYGVSLRVQDNNNHYAAYVSGAVGGTLRLYKRVAGTFTALAQVTGTGFASGKPLVLRASMVGAILSGSATQGSHSATLTASDTAFANAGAVGCDEYDADGTQIFQWFRAVAL